MEVSKDLVERLKTRRTQTVVSLRERLYLSRKRKELVLLEKRKRRELEERQLFPILPEQRSEANEEGT
tara:strand:- start:166 stop:369 length:204 start_codon:yes stop_codon:yes gene_type:complete